MVLFQWKSSDYIYRMQLPSKQKWRAKMESYYTGEFLCLEDNAASEKTLFLKRSRDLSATGSCKIGSLLLV